MPAFSPWTHHFLLSYMYIWFVVPYYSHVMTKLGSRASFDPGSPFLKSLTPVSFYSSSLILIQGEVMIIYLPQVNLLLCSSGTNEGKFFFC